MKLKGVLHLNQLSLKLGMKGDDVACPEFPTLKVLEIDFYSQMGGLRFPLSLHSLTINCITLNNENQSFADFLSLTQSLKELNLSFCSNEVEPIFKALATNASLPLERLELHCDKCQMNTATYAHFITFISEKSTLQYFFISSFGITVCKLKEVVQAINREPTHQSLGMDIVIANNLLELKRTNSRNISDDERVCFSIFRKEEHIFTASHLKYEPNSETELVVKIPLKSISKPPLSYNIATDLAAAFWFSDTSTDTVIQALNHDSNTVKFIISRTWLGDNGNVALALALSHRFAIQELKLTRISNDKVQAIANALHHSKPVGSITLSIFSIKDSGATDLAQAIRENYHFQKITLSYCDVGGTQTAELLYTCSQL